jgi:hypothetical protein
MEPISRAVSVFSQSSTHSAHRSVPSDDWVSPPPPQGGCCGFGAKQRGAAPRQAPARATAYVAPVVTRPVPASDVVTRSPPSPFRATTPPPPVSPPAPTRVHAPVSPLAPTQVNPPIASAPTVVEKVVEKIVEKRVYNISDDELLAIKEELLVLREQVLAKAESLKSSNLKMHEMEKENRDLRAEYNLQSLKQEMLVHMWSMHMLDADVEDDAST